MYIPEHFAEADPEALAAVIRDHNFGTLITSGAQGLFATHLPFVAGNERPPRRLRAHMAKANPHLSARGLTRSPSSRGRTPTYPQAGT
jgi:transcriptional regulator